MCRFACYLRAPVRMADVIIKPAHSLLSQSYAAKETQHTFNADGFGVGWYDHRINDTPGVFTSIQPAWNDINLINLTKKILSECFFAHIRAATLGGVSQRNCHPFDYGKYLFMHNGMIDGFDKIKRAVRRQLTDEVYGWIKGETDSEHFAALFVHLHQSNQRKDTPEDYVTTMRETIASIQTLKAEYGCGGLSLLNVAFTDGENLVVSRFSTQPEKDTNTLYYSQNHEQLSSGQESIIVASERLTMEHCHWKEVPVNHVLVADRQMHVECIAL